MIVQDVGFTGVSLFEGNTPRIFESSEVEGLCEGVRIHE